MSTDLNVSIFAIPQLRQELASVEAMAIRGRVTAVQGPLIRAALSGAACGDLVRIRTRNRKADGRWDSLLAQVVSFDRAGVTLSPFTSSAEVIAGSEIEHLGRSNLQVGPHLLGTVLSSTGAVLRRYNDLSRHVQTVSFSAKRLSKGGAREALRKKPIAEYFPTGIRALDAFVTVGEGQRLAVVAEPGVGKTSLLAELARNAGADVIVIALIGERGREVNEFISRELDEETRRRSVTVISTSDEAAAARINAAEIAVATAESFRDQGQRVLLLMDSLTRLARAFRELGLAAGEPPVRHGYPPSLYAELPRLIERAGNWETGSITAFYTVLSSGDIIEDPLVEEVLSLVDGQIVLSKVIADTGRFPAVDILRSLSRLQAKLISDEFKAGVTVLKKLVVAYQADRDLHILSGSASEKFQAIDRVYDELEHFLHQERRSFEHLTSLSQRLMSLSERAKEALSI